MNPITILLKIDDDARGAIRATDHTTSVLDERTLAIIHRLCARPVAEIPPTLDLALAEVRAEVEQDIAYEKAHVHQVSTPVEEEV